MTHTINFKIALLTLLFIVLGIEKSNAQTLEDCSKCDQIKYSRSDINTLPMHRLQQLRNEIFARKGYKFKDEMLSSYFEQFDWYKPTSQSEPSLNKTEEANVKLIQQREKEILSRRAEIEKALKALQKDFKEGKTRVIRKQIDDAEVLPTIMNALEQVLQKISLNDGLYWVGDNCIMSIEIDNGKEISYYGLQANSNENTVTFSYSDIFSMSNNLKKLEETDSEAPYSYPYNYASEEEWMFWVVMEVVEGKLKYKSWNGAG